MSETLVEIIQLKKYFPIMGGVLQKQVGYVYAVDDITFKIMKGETLGLVGESGCGKTTVGRCILLLIKPTDGTVRYMGKEITIIESKDLKWLGKEMAMIFQDPYSSLNPKMSVGDIIGEPLVIHDVCNRKEGEERVKELIKKVGLSPYHMSRYPHQFSGGQMQRIGIARAIALNPKFIIADEAVAALDVSVRATILNLMDNLQKELGLTYLFISHDLSVIRHICDRVAVMYLGKLVEVAETEELFNNPQHPYTNALISAIPIPDPRVKKERIILPGSVPTPINPPSGCRFHPRCKYARKECSETEPKMLEFRKGHFVACYLRAK